MASATLQIDRPVLPSIQDLLSDREFNKLRLQSPKDIRPNTPATTNVAASQRMVRDAKVLSRQEPLHPLLRSSSSCSPLSSPPSHGPCGAARTCPYRHAHPSGSPSPPESAGKAFEKSLPGRHVGYSHVSPHVGRGHETGRPSTAQQTLSTMDLPTYILSPNQCPPDDDRRHGCGICHRRFNRPSSLMIHMNSHTGAQPFKCPFPGCTRRFSVNSNMRRHYRNHRDGAAMTAQAQPYPAPYYRTPEPPHPYYSASSPSSSPPSSPSLSDEGHFDAAEAPPCAPGPSGPARSRSTVLPRAEDRPSGRPRACTVPGCHCDIQAPGALRPAFQLEQEPSARFSPNHR
ncbi:hypothetical protein LXA43DRAFT_1074667 [Ganoderma leucocontextum]|nr:hypothetical protein LXA43DRAFT_1074667 [Ganoderma leucocontextum]